MLIARILISCLLYMTIFSAKAQKIRSEMISYHYYKLPSAPLDKKYTNYQVHIEAPYKERNRQLLEAYELEVRTAKEKFNRDSISYEKDRIAADTRYEKEMEEYKKKTVGTKILEKKVLGEDTKPVKYNPSKPYLQRIGLPALKTEYDHILLADTYFEFYGFNKVNTNPIQILVTLYGYDYTQPRVLTEQKDMVSAGKTTSTYKATYYHSEFSYRHPMAIKVTLPEGKEILNITPQELNVYQIFKTHATNGQQSVNAELLVKSREETVLQNNLSFLSNLLNDKFGKGPSKREAQLFFIKSKSDEYADLTNAFNEASSGLQMIRDDSATSRQKLLKAAIIWTNALKESDPSDKKARIDKDVTIKILFNLLEVYFATGDTVSGGSTLEKLNALSMDAGERKFKNAFELLFNDLKKRQLAQL